MQDEKRFYVYVHRRKTDGRIFYVGKGTKLRAFSHLNRSEWWKRTASKHGVDVTIETEMITEPEAFALEKILIRRYKEEGHPLVNITDGGGGFSGGRHTEISKKLISIAATGSVKSPEARKKISDKARLRTHTEDTKRKLSDYFTGRPIDCSFYKVTHEDGTVFEGLRKDISEAIGIPSFSLCRIISGKRNGWRGWSIEKL